ncbi:MAG: FAD-dependent oxidoreductase [Deltaproteobacteria bacterium]|nr:FAD-dependent oxidoreductase [Deltaproteobacteria bacterium]
MCGRGTFDVGGQWIGPGQKRVHALANELGIATFPTYVKGKKVLEVEGKVSTYKRSIRSMSVPNLIQMQGALSYLKRVRKRISPSGPMTAEGAEALDGETLETWRARFVKSDKINAVMDAAIRTIFGAEARDLSALYFLMHLNAGGGMLSLSEARGGAQQDRFVPGAQSISLALAKELGDAVALGLPVRKLVQSSDGVDAVSDAETIGGRYAIVSVPPVLAGRIEYEPAVSVGRDQVTQRFAMGAAVKVLLTYERAFWRDAGFSGEVVSSDGPLSVTFGRPPASRDERAQTLLRGRSGFVPRVSRARLGCRAVVAWLSGRWVAAGGSHPLVCAPSQTRGPDPLGWHRICHRMDRLHGGCHPVRRARSGRSPATAVAPRPFTYWG